MEVIKNETLIDTKALIQFNIYHFNKNIMQIIIACLGTIFGSICLNNYIKAQEFYNILFAIAFILLPIFSRLFILIFIRLKFKNMKIENTINKYEFALEYFIYNNEKYYYKDLKKVKTYKNYLYLYIDNNKAFIVENVNDLFNRIKNVAKK